MITVPLALARTDGCRGTARLFWNVVSITPIGLYDMHSEGDDEVEGMTL
jgi:hypothetical protein